MTDKKPAGTDRIPPNAIEVEMIVLGSMMYDNIAASTVVDVIDDSDLFADKHKTIFNAARELYDENIPIDLVTITEKLHAKEKLEEIGGASYLNELYSSVASSANVEHHARIIKRKATYRKLIHACTFTIDKCHIEPDDETEVLSDIESQIFHLMNLNDKGSGARHINKGVIELYNEIVELKKSGGGSLGITTGIKGLNDITSGWLAGNMIVLAGRPSMGKTALALEFARAAAGLGQTPVAVFSLEQTYKEVVLRLTCAGVELNTFRARNGQVSDGELADLQSKLKDISNLPILIDDSATLNGHELRARARRLAIDYKIGMIVVDYIGLMHHHKKTENQQQQISALSRSLKATAKELNIPVIVLSQLSRGVEQRTVKKPILSDLRDSGAIEQDADIVMLMYRPGYYKKDESPNETELIIAKQRNGATGTIRLWFDLSTGRFTEIIASKDEGRAMPTGGAEPKALDNDEEDDDLPF